MCVCVQTRKQIDPCLLDKSLARATASIVKNEGIRALLAGLGPTTYGYLIEGAFKFGIYEVTKPVVQNWLVRLAQWTSLSFLSTRWVGFVFCGTVSGVAASALLCPMEAIRIRQVAEPDFAPNGWIEGGYKMLRYEGVLAMSKGWVPMLCKQVPYTVAKNVGFDVVTRLCYEWVKRGGFALTTMVKVGVPVFAAFWASIISTIFSQPGDMLLSLVNAHEGDKRTKDFVQEIMASEQGVRGFFLGLKTRFLHLGIIVTVQLVIYEFIKRLCGIAATGSV